MMITILMLALLTARKIRLKEKNMLTSKCVHLVEVTTLTINIVIQEKGVKREKWMIARDVNAQKEVKKLNKKSVKTRTKQTDAVLNLKEKVEVTRILISITVKH